MNSNEKILSCVIQAQRFKQKLLSYQTDPLWEDQMEDWLLFTAYWPSQALADLCSHKISCKNPSVCGGWADCAVTNLWILTMELWFYLCLDIFSNSASTVKTPRPSAGGEAERRTQRGKQKTTDSCRIQSEAVVNKAACSSAEELQTHHLSFVETEQLFVILLWHILKHWQQHWNNVSLDLTTNNGWYDKYVFTIYVVCINAYGLSPERWIYKFPFLLIYFFDTHTLLQHTEWQQPITQYLFNSHSVLVGQLHQVWAS